MNCQDICPYKKQCLQLFNHHGHETDSKYPHSECPMAWKIEDLLMDASDIQAELEMDDEDPFLGIHNPTVYLSRAEMKAIEGGM